MLRHVPPGPLFWLPLVFVFASVSLQETYSLDIFRKGIFLVDVVVKPALTSGWVSGILVFLWVFVDQLDPSVDRLFQGYGGVKKATGAALLFLGNVLVYFFSEKSVACMLAFFFVACFWFCVLCCLQPCTDFGVLDFLLSACLNVALSLFRVRIYTWLLSFACILVILLRYFLDPMRPPEEAVSSSSPVEVPAIRIDYSGIEENEVEEGEEQPPAISIDYSGIEENEVEEQPPAISIDYSGIEENEQPPANYIDYSGIEENEEEEGEEQPPAIYIDYSGIEENEEEKGEEQRLCIEENEEEEREELRLGISTELKRFNDPLRIKKVISDVNKKVLKKSDVKKVFHDAWRIKKVLKKSDVNKLFQYPRRIKKVF